MMQLINVRQVREAIVGGDEIHRSDTRSICRRKRSRALRLNNRFRSRVSAPT
jgi:hypothetical protein